MTRPEVSVVLPFHRLDHFLWSAVDSVTASRDVSFELLLVADGLSSSEYGEVLRLAGRDKNVKVLRNNGQGLVDALNTGVALATSEYVARMDSDDVMQPLRLRRQADFLSSNPSCALVGSQVSYICQHGVDIGHSSYPALVKRRYKNKPSSPVVAHPATMFRKTHWLQLKGYRHGFEQAEDLDFWNRLIELGDIVNLDGILLKYRIHPGQVSLMKHEKQIMSSLMACLADLGFEGWESLHESSSIDELFEIFPETVRDLVPRNRRREAWAHYFFYALRRPVSTWSRWMLFARATIFSPVVAFRFASQVVVERLGWSVGESPRSRPICDLCQKAPNPHLDQL